MLAKPTATFDVINFTITLVALWFGGIIALGVFLGIMGVIGKSGILTVQKFLTSSSANTLLATGAGVTLVGALVTWFKKKWQHLRYVLVWAAVIIGTLLVVKAPYVIAKEIKIDHKFQPTQLIKDIILSKNTTTTHPILLASNVAYSDLLAADMPVSGANSTATGATTTAPTVSQALAACKAQNISTADLYKDLKTPPGNALDEDVGRYIGYGWRTFTAPWW